MAKRKTSQFPVLTKFQQQAETTAARLARLEAENLARSSGASRFAGRKLVATATRVGQQLADTEKETDQERRPEEISPQEVREVFAEKQAKGQQVQATKVQEVARNAARQEIRQVGKAIAKQFTRQALATATKALLTNPYVLAVLAVIGLAVMIIVLIFAIGLGAAGSDPAISGTSVQQPIDPVSHGGTLKSVLAGSVRSATAAKTLLAELQKLRKRFDTNPAATSTINTLQKAAEAMIASPNDQTVLAEKSAVISAEMAELLALLTMPERIAITALSKVTDPTENYYAPNPTRACAAFVGKILREVKAVPTVCSFRAVTLASEVEKFGATRIIADNTPLNHGSVSQLAAGDIIFFNKKPGYYGHTGIAIGGGEMVDTSSSERKVKKRPVMDLSNDYQAISSFRFN